MGRVINTTSSNLKKYKEEQIKEMKNLVIDTVTTIEIEATRSVPASQKGTKFINIDKQISKSGLKGEVGVMGNNNLAAYFEFGTGLSAGTILAPYPEWIKKIAMKFYINGRGTLEGKPYLYPSVLKNFTIFKSELKKIINRGVVKDK